MKKNPLFVAVSNQKGGVGKSTMLVTLASLLNYSMGKNVAIVDCDATQRSLFNLRERDMEMVEINKKYMVWLFLACADRARGNCTNSFLVKTDGKGEIYPNPQST